MGFLVTLTVIYMPITTGIRSVAIASEPHEGDIN